MFTDMALSTNDSSFNLGAVIIVLITLDLTVLESVRGCA